MDTIGDVNACKKCLSELLKEVTEKKIADIDVHRAALQQDNNEEEEEQAILSIGSRKRTAMSSSDTPTTVFKAKKGKSGKGLMDSLIFRRSEEALKLGDVKRQPSGNDACDKEARARTIQYIARFIYRKGIALNVVRSKSFKLMIEAIGNYGPHLKVPSYHESGVPLLKKEMKKTKEMLKGHKEEWSKFGCSIMLDAWTDKKNRTLINFMVNCSYGTMFLKSVDASAYMKTGDKLFELLDTFVEEIGEKNVVQVITDNNSNYVLAGKLLQAKRTNLYWTPCVACCVDLMLEDIGRIPRVKRTIQRGVTLVGFIYNHSLALNMMRKCTNKIELVRCGVTRFATTFLTLQRLHKQKNNLRKMFTSDEWLKSKISKDAKGKRATNIVLMPTFWNDVVYSLKVMGPLVHVLRLVYNEKSPAMGNIYEVMHRAKEAIQRSFNGNEDKYKDIFSIIDKRWECQLHYPLHAAGYFLNPKFFYSNPQIEFDSKVLMGLYQCMERLIPTEEGVDKITNELPLYKRAGGIFGFKAAIRQRVTLAPAEWWRMYGLSTPNLQAFAIKVLSLTSCAYGCERNWSIFENIHFKKRSKLEQKKLEDLVLIKYNQDLKEHFDNLDAINPILLNDIDDSNEWVVGEIGGERETNKEELVFNDDTLAWGIVANVVGAGEPTTFTKQQGRLKKKETSRPSTSRARDIIADEEEEVKHDVESEEEEEEEEEEIYKYINSESDNDEESLEDTGDDEFD